MSSVAETKRVFDACHAAWTRGAKTVLAIVTEVEGSAYRRPGAKMLLTNDSQMLGSLSGGCLEADLYLHAERVAVEDQATQVHYDLGQDAMWNLGVGCQGTIDVLLLPLTPGDTFWTTFNEAAINGRSIVWLQEIPEGQRALVSDDGRCVGDSLPGHALALAQASLAHPSRSRVVKIGLQKFFLDVILPVPDLIVSGAGADAATVADLAATVGFQVSVIDLQSEFNHANQIGVAAEHVKMDPSPAKLSVPRSSFWLIMNHHRQRDQFSIALALASSPRWIGVLGPRGRTASLLANLSLDFDDGPFVSPVGLDLGAETAEEVALSIVAQLLAAERGKNAAPLHGRQHIH